MTKFHNFIKEAVGYIRTSTSVSQIQNIFMNRNYFFTGLGLQIKPNYFI